MADDRPRQSTKGSDECLKAPTRALALHRSDNERRARQRFQRQCTRTDLAAAFADRHRIVAADDRRNAIGKAGGNRPDLGLAGA